MATVDKNTLRKSRQAATNRESVALDGPRKLQWPSNFQEAASQRLMAALNVTYKPQENENGEKLCIVLSGWCVGLPST